MLMRVAVALPPFLPVTLDVPEMSTLPIVTAPPAIETSVACAEVSARSTPLVVRISEVDSRSCAATPGPSTY